MHNLFAFNVSKEIVDVPTISSVYDPEQQVSLWLGGDNTVLAFYCTSAPYWGVKCKIGSNGMGGFWCVAPADPNGRTSYNTKCDS